MAIYSKEQRLSTVGAALALFELDAPMRGTLNRFLLKQLTGVAAGFTYALYCRRGASSIANDLNTPAGLVSTVGNGSSHALVTTAAAHGLKIGDRVVIKGTTQSGYNTTHVVATVPSSVTFTTDVAYGSAATGGFWQVETNPLLGDSDSYLILDRGTVNSGAAAKLFGVEYDYENRDVQSVTARRRATKMYLEITPGGTGAKTHEVAYTVTPLITD